MMKNRIRTILALALAMTMLAGCGLGALAEEKLGDLECIVVVAEYCDDANEVHYMVNEEYGNWQDAESGVITTGNVTQAQYGEGPAVDVRTWDGEVTLTTGDVTATWPRDAAVSILTGGDADKDKVSVTTGHITAPAVGLDIENNSGCTEAVTGGIDAGSYGVLINGQMYGLGGGGAHAEEGQPALFTKATVNGDVNVTAGDAVAGVEALGSREGETVTAIVDGDVTVTSKEGEEPATLGGIILIAGEGEVTGNVTGSVTVENSAGSAVGAAVAANDACGATLDIGEDLVVAGGAGEAAGVVTWSVYLDDEDFFNMPNMGYAEVNVGGAVRVTGGQFAVGVDALQWDGNPKEFTTVTVGNGIEVAAEGEACGIMAETGGEEASVTVTVEDGGVKAEGEEATGIETWNYDGAIEVTVNGGVESSGTGIRVKDDAWMDILGMYEGTIVPDENDERVEMYGEEWYLTTVDGQQIAYVLDDGEVAEALMVEDGREDSSTKVAVTGDVIAGETAIDVSLTTVKSAVDVIVDGTVEGKEHAIVVSQGTIGDNLTMTVWEVKPNEDGSLVERRSNDGETYTADRDLEKAIQYIIRIEDNSKDYIATSGTQEYEGYNVAKEGETVLVKLTIPEGKELVGAYWDEEQTEAGKLLQDEEGNYYVEVPRGGGVVLSVLLKDVEGDAQPQKAAVTFFKAGYKVILTIKDLSGKCEIEFRSDGTYEARYEGGTKEEGSFRLADGQIVLVNSAGHEMPVTQDGDGYKLVYTAGGGEGEFEFRLAEADVQALAEAVK